ncbi:minor tail protein [Gordonia phage Holliday]|nr:minor tail protein [Gordonia phage Holliday]
MIVLAGRVVTPVPNRPYVFTAVPVSRVGVVLPAVPHVRTRLPAVPSVGVKLPSVPRYRTRRPPTKERLVAGNTMSVSGSAVVHARLGVEFAEQSVQVDQVGKLAVGVNAAGSAVVLGSAVVRALYTVTGTNSIDTGASGVARPRHVLAASQAIVTATDGGGARALYALAATQDIVVDQPVVSRPLIEVDAAQGMGVASTASSVPSVGTVNADATQSLLVESVAVVRVRHSVAAVQGIETGESTILDGVRVPLSAIQNVVVSGVGDGRARYSLNASNSLAVADVATPVPSLAAAGSSLVDGTALSRARHTLAASSSAVVDSTATATAAYFAYDNSTVIEGSSTTSVNLTVAANATIIVFVAGNTTNAARVDGVNMSLVGKTSNAAMYYATGLAAGSRAIQVDRSTSSGHIVTAVSYTGVSSVSGGVTASGTSNTPSGTPTGSGGRTLVGFDFSAGSAEIDSVTSNGEVRVKYRRTTGNCLAVADRAGSPVTLSTPASGSWTSIAVRLT